MTRLSISFISVLPSPYQQDLFRVLAADSRVQLSVFYLEREYRQAPWPRPALAAYERVLPGFWIPFGNVRFHMNWKFPSFESADLVVMNGFSSLTSQWLMRRCIGKRPWIFWGERLQTQKSAIRAAVQRLLTRPLAKASGIVAVGRRAAEEYSCRYPHLPCVSVPYYCDLNPFFQRQALPGAREEITFLFCGQLVFRKGVDLLLQAFDRLVTEGHKARLLLVGQQGNLESYLKPISKAARARITYAGFLAPLQLPEQFGQADIFVLPSRYDGWGVVLNQALGAGLPIISSDATGAARELIEPGQNGCIVAAGDLEALYNAMRSLIIQRANLLHWGAVSRMKALDWTPEKGARRWVDIAQQFIKRADSSC